MLEVLERMRSNPRGDWRIADIERLCRQYGVACEAPRRGSHHKLTHPLLPDHVTVPARRPIKAVYIRDVVAFVDRARRANEPASIPRDR